MDYREFYNNQWQSLDDFIRYNPGARHRRRIIFNILSKINYNNAIDIGCGPGELLIWLKKHHPDKALSGADISNAVLEKNKQNMPDIDFHELNIEEQSLNNTFDLVVCSEVIEHLPKQPEAIRNLINMVKPNGHLLISCPTGKRYATEKYFGHIRHPSIDDIECWMRDHGMTIKICYNWGFPSYKILKELTNINSEWAINNFAKGKYNFFQKAINNIIYAGNFMNISNSRLGCQIFMLAQKGDI